MVRDPKEIRATNVVDFSNYKTIRDINNLKFLNVLAVRANPLTGEWIEEPYPTDETITSETWSAQEDLSDIHFTTIERVSPTTGKVRTYALLVNWLPIKDGEEVTYP
jgi:hypothetical protein